MNFGSFFLPPVQKGTTPFIRNQKVIFQTLFCPDNTSSVERIESVTTDDIWQDIYLYSETLIFSMITSDAGT